MAVRFSCTLAFIASIFESMALNRGKVFTANMPTNTAMNGSANRNTTARSALILTAIIVAATSMNGARMNVRTADMYVFCIVFTSVVSLVIRLAVEKRSTFAKEKACTLSNRSPLRFFAKPALATLANLAESMPRLSDKSAISIIISPRCNIKPVSRLAMPMFTISAIRNGIFTSTTTSPTIVSAASRDFNLYPFVYGKSFLIIPCSHPPFCAAP